MKIRHTTNAAPVAPAAAATAEIFAAGERINITTTVPNQRILARLTVSRDNADPAGNGTYRFVLDGAPFGTARVGPTGTNAEGLTVLEDLIVPAVAGAHQISAQVTSNGDVETVSAGAVLVTEGA